MPLKYFKVSNENVTESMGIALDKTTSEMLFTSNDEESFDPADEITKEQANFFLAQVYAGLAGSL